MSCCPCRDGIYVHSYGADVPTMVVDGDSTGFRGAVCYVEGGLLMLNPYVDATTAIVPYVQALRLRQEEIPPGERALIDREVEALRAARVAFEGALRCAQRALGSHEDLCRIREQMHS